MRIGTQRLFLALLPVLLTVTACSPRLQVEKYSYLLEQNQKPAQSAPANQPTLDASSPAVAGPDEVFAEVSGVSIASADYRETQRIVQEAKSYLGTPYRYGGMSRQGVDCSGLICLSYQAIDKALPRSSQSMANSGRDKPRHQVVPGDLVFFHSKKGMGINHVGMVVEGRGAGASFIHATVSGGVRIDRLDDPYWRPRFRKAMTP